MPTALESPATPRLRRPSRGPWLLLALLLAAAVALYVSHRRERTAGGLTATELSLKLFTGSLEDRKVAERALQKLGTNALPSLTRALQKADMPMRRTIERIARRLPAGARNWVYRRVLYPDPTVVRAAAAQAISLLGTNGLAAAPELVAVIQRQDRAAAWPAAAALGKLGPGVVPFVLPLLNDPDPQIRLSAISALGEARQDAAAAVPVLAAQLGATNDAIRNLALYTLNRIWTNPTLGYADAIRTQHGPARSNLLRLALQPPVSTRTLRPAVLEAVADETPGVRQQAVAALAFLQPWDRDAFVALCRARNDPHPSVGAEAIAALSARNLRARMSVHSLREMLADSRFEFRAEAAQVLAGLGTNALPASNTLAQASMDPNPAVREAAQAALHQLTNAPAR